MTAARGTILVDAFVRDQQRRRETLDAWLEQKERRELRREEDELLGQWWRAEEADRLGIVKANPAIFTRIRKNRLRAHRLTRQERRETDARMRRAGYRVRTGNQLPRYVRS